jgi:hypothetical protein
VYFRGLSDLLIRINSAPSHTVLEEQSSRVDFPLLSLDAVRSKPPSSPTFVRPHTLFWVPLTQDPRYVTCLCCTIHEAMEVGVHRFGCNGTSESDWDKVFRNLGQQSRVSCIEAWSIKLDSSLLGWRQHVRLPTALVWTL